MAEPSGGGEAARARILTVGDELLSGETADRNGPWLAARLRDAGFRVVGLSSVGDDPGALGQAMLDAGEGVRLLVITGGLGPTRDDRTREEAARVLGLALSEDEAILDGIRARFRARGHEDAPETNHRIARVPEGATVLANPAGTAPGLALAARDGAHWLLLPGPPRELQAVWDASVVPLLDRLVPDRPLPDQVRVIRTTGIPESALAEELEPRMARHPQVKVAWRASLEGTMIRLSAPGGSGGQGLEALEAEMAESLAPWRWEAPSGDLAQAVLEAFGHRGWTLSVAESCTGGGVGARLTAHPGSSRVFLGGVIAYDNRLKEGLLDVPPTTLESAGAVSGEAACAMAAGIRRRTGSDVALSVTGVAGPGGGHPDKPVGTVWFGLAGPGEGARAHREWFPGDRDEVRARATQHGLHALLRQTNPRRRDG